MADARHLRNALQQNAHDARLATDDGVKFVYLLDRPVFSIFAEPDSYGLALTAFPSFYEPELDSGDTDPTALADGENPVDQSGRPLVAEEYLPSQGVLFVNALLASEYLFTEKATFDNQILISPEHAHELHAFAISLTRRLEASPINSSGSVGNAYDHLRRWLILQLEHRSDKTSLELLDKIRDGIVEQLGSLDSPMVALYRLDRIFESNMLRHAAEALSFDAELISPDPGLIAQWRIRIRQAKRRNPRQPNPHAVEADAITLAQLELLNRDWKRERRLCVLVSNDRGLHRAWSAWQREADSKTERRVSALRDPRQLIPILDPHSTADVNRSPVVGRVRRALDQLLSSVATNDTEPAGEGAVLFVRHADQDIAIEMERHLRGSGADSRAFRAILQQQIDEVAASWLQLLEYSIVDRADLVARFADSEAATWSQALGSALKQQSDSLAKDVADKFFTLATSSALLRTEVWALATRGQPMSANRRRLVTDFDRFESDQFRSKSLQKAVDDLQDDVGGAIAELQGVEPNERLLVIGCMCLGIGSWAMAKSLLEVASKLEADVHLKREAVFFSCVARRLAADQHDFRNQYSSIEKDLQNLLKNPRNDLDRLRILNENVALLLCRLPFLISKSAADLTETVARSTKIWREVVRLHGEKLLKAQTSAAMQALQKQFALNTFCLSYYQYQVLGKPSIDVRDYALELLNARKRPRKGFEWLKEGVHGGVYPLMSQFVMAGNPAKRDFAKKILRSALDALKRDADAGFIFDIPFVDRLELTLVCDEMKQSISGP